MADYKVDRLFAKCSFLALKVLPMAGICVKSRQLAPTCRQFRICVCKVPLCAPYIHCAPKGSNYMQRKMPFKLFGFSTYINTPLDMWKSTVRNELFDSVKSAGLLGRREIASELE